MNDFSKILNKAKELESNMKESREKIKKITAEGVSGGGNVKITLNGDNEIVEIKISKEIYTPVWKFDNKWTCIYSGISK